MQRICKASGEPFEIAPEDLEFYKKVSPKIGDKTYEIPPPTLCPEERQRRRLAFRNERNLYQRKCDFSNENIISIYSSDKPFKIYDQDIWWSDAWNPLDYGRDFDFNRTFFEQFKDLMLSVPRLAMFNKGSENSTYTNHGVYNKNCYMGFNIGYSEDTLYSGDVVVKCKNCIDLTNVLESELCYFCIDGKNLYNSRNLILCSNCSDSAFLYDCKGCSNCFMCFNLRHKSFCINNKQYSKEEYFQEIRKYDSGNFQQYQKFSAQFNQIIQEEAVHQAAKFNQSENINGNFIFNSKNIFRSFDVQESEDLRYCYDVWDIKDCMDAYQTMDKAELHYETHASSVSVHALFCNISHENNEIIYTDHCFNSNNLFGCISLKRQEYCILNKKYSKQDYKQLLAKIIEHMQKTGEWGEFFPVELSPFAYNETVAQEYFPMTKEEVLAKGWKWRDETNEIPKVEKIIPARLLPNAITDVPDDILSWAIECEESGKPFIIQKPELEFYRKMQLPIPHFHPDVRHAKRMAKRNPRKLWNRNCDNCGKTIETTYALERPERVFCEDCYQKAVY